ncbi:23451_t:CDS:2, partial [Dentiscutata erythropus]
MSQQINCSFCLKFITNYRNITDDLKFKIDNCPDKRYYQELKPKVDKLCSKSENSRSNTSTNLTEISNLIETSESNSSMTLMKTSESNSSTTLMEPSSL